MGALFASSRDYIEATASSDTDQFPAEVVNGGQPVRSVTLLAMPELDAELRLGSVSIGAGLILAILPIEGPELPHGALKVLAACDPTNPTPAACAQDSSAVQSERAFGSFLLWMPQVNASYAF